MVAVPPAWVTATAFLVGAMVGSFLNVCACRLPQGKSLWWPGSACPACGHPIRWHDNVPVLSFLLLRGRCRDCRRPIAWRYPAVELGTALLFALATLEIGWRRELGPALLFLSALVVITVIDLERQLIPDRITLPGTVAGFLASLVTPRLSWKESLLGILAGGGILFVIIVVSGGGMGGGDMKLGAMMGAFLGWQLLLVGLLLAVFVGGAVAAALLAMGRKARKDPLPFGPFLALGGGVSAFWGKGILEWYLGALVG